MVSTAKNRGYLAAPATHHLPQTLFWPLPHHIHRLSRQKQRIFSLSILRFVHLQHQLHFHSRCRAHTGRQSLRLPRDRRQSQYWAWHCQYRRMTCW